MYRSIKPDEAIDPANPVVLDAYREAVRLDASDHTASSLYVVGFIGRLVERAWRIVGVFPWFCYWLWTFECINENTTAPTPLDRHVLWTAPSGFPEGTK